MPTYHISGAECLEDGAIRFKPVAAQHGARADDWLPRGPLTLGLTAGPRPPTTSWARWC